MGSTPILELRNVSKSFGAVDALKAVDFYASPGEVTALVGDTGAGKSTLVKCISGTYSIDSGEYYFDDDHFAELGHRLAPLQSASAFALDARAADGVPRRLGCMTFARSPIVSKRSPTSNPFMPFSTMSAMWRSLPSISQRAKVVKSAPFEPLPM